LVQKEHVVLFDNSTVFNDLIYQPSTGYRQERLKVLGATELQILQQKIMWQLKLADGDEKNADVIQTRIDLRNKELEIIKNQAGEIRKMMSTSLADSLKSGDLTTFFSSFQEKLRNAILDAVAESMINQAMSMTGLDVALGIGMESLKFERAILDGSTIGSKMYRDAIVSASAQAAQTVRATQGAVAPGGMSYMPQGYTGATANISGMGTVPVRPAPFSSWNMQNFAKVAGAGLMAYSLMGGMKGSSSMSQAHATGLGRTTDRASTRDTVKAKVTNIVNNINFNLEGMSIDDQKAMRLIGSRLGEVIKETVIQILESENISSGNV
jgi:hypothetical protein